MYQLPGPLVRYLHRIITVTEVIRYKLQLKPLCVYDPGQHYLFAAAFGAEIATSYFKYSKHYEISG